MRAGKQKTAALGAYPAVSLAEARSARDAAKTKLRAGQDPVEAGKVEKAEARAAVTTFADTAAEWFKVKMAGENKAAKTLSRAALMIKTLGAELNGRPIAEIEAPALLTLLRRVEAQGHHEVSKRLLATASMVFRFGIATGACKRNPAADLKGALTSKKTTPRAAIVEPAAVGKMLKDIDGYPRLVVRQALRLLALTFLRPAELTKAEWSEIDFDAGTWIVPAARMKMRKEFHVPLSRQALAVLKEARAGAGNSRFVFPSLKRGKPLQTGKLTQALRAMGYEPDECTAHGFRATASTLLNDEGTRFSPDVVELCLSHMPKGVRAIYNRSLRWPERVTLMAWWADKLDELRARGAVVKLPAKKRS
jgi:integrase